MCIRDRAEGVAGRVEKHPDVLLRLVLGQTRTEPDRALGLGCEVGDLEVQVQHQLLSAGHPRPGGADIVRIALDAQIGNALTGVEGAVVLVEVMNGPATQRRIEVGKPGDVVGVEHHAPPVVPLPTVRPPVHAP